MIEIVPISLLICIHCITYSQQVDTKYSVKQSTITYVGSSNYVFNNQKIKVLHSIGQSGIIGTIKTENFTIQQGFINSYIYLKIDNANSFIKEELEFIISPNPFKDHIIINFSNETKYNIQVRVFDINGKNILKAKFDATKRIKLPLRNFSIGTYLIRVESGINIKTKKIIKTGS